MVFIYVGQLKVSQLPVHGIVGLGVMVLGIVQPLNACLRPHGDSWGRRFWEVLHKGFGRMATFGGVFNCVGGAMKARQQHPDEIIFTLFSGVSFGLACFFMISYSIVKFVACARARFMPDSEQGMVVDEPPTDAERPGITDAYGLPEETSKNLDQIFQLFDETSQKRRD